MRLLVATLLITFLACCDAINPFKPKPTHTMEKIVEARSAGKKDNKNFQWKWFAASYITVNASVIVLGVADMLNCNLDGKLDNINRACCFTLYGAYLLIPLQMSA